jgi:hypothetical protein
MFMSMIGCWEERSIFRALTSFLGGAAEVWVVFVSDHQLLEETMRLLVMTSDS